MKRRGFTKSIKLSNSPVLLITLLIGFGIGFSSKNYLYNDQQIVSHNQATYQKDSQTNGKDIFVCFTPGKQCQSQIISQINKAKESIYVQAYSFTDSDIAQALVNAAKRGVHVRVLLDKSNYKDNRSTKDIIIQNHIPTRFDYPPGIAHCKIIILDQTITLTGSYNFSSAAYKRNTENLLIITNKDIAQKYIQNWKKRWDISREGGLSHG